MPRRDDTLDSQIHAALLGAALDDVDVARAEASVRASAAARRTRRRVLGGVASVGLIGWVGVVLVDTTPEDAVVTDAPVASTTSSSSAPVYGFAPLTPLLDEPLPIIPSTELTVDDGHVFTVESRPETLALRLTDATGSAGATSADAMRMPALLSFRVGPSSMDPTPKSYIGGVTRAEVARLDLVTATGTTTVVLIDHVAFPQLRFFLVEVPDDVLGANGNLGTSLSVPLLIAYDADGRVLTDSDRVHAEGDAFAEAMDRRQGVEYKAAGILDVDVSVDGMMLTVRIFSCGGEAGDEVRVIPTIDDRAVRIAATVRRPYVEGDCLSGDTVELGIGLNEPLGSRNIVDDRTGEPIPLRPRA